MPNQNKNTKEYVIKELQKDGIKIKVRKTNAYEDKNYSRILPTKRKIITNE